MYDALHDYLKDSELRIADENLYVRMSPELAQKYDAGDYDARIAEYRECIHELATLNLGRDGQDKFYMYLVPDDRCVELLEYPYKDAKSGGCPVRGFFLDGEWAYGLTQNMLLRQEKLSLRSRAMVLHEWSHLVMYQYISQTKHLLFSEGFADLVPWYLLNYDKKNIGHILPADRLLWNRELFFQVDTAPYHCASFQRSYISSYIFVRTIIEKIEKNYNLGKAEAAKLWLNWCAESKVNRGWLVEYFAKKLGLDTEKLLYTTEYQKEVLQEMSNFAKIDGNTTKRMDAIIR